MCGNVLRRWSCSVPQLQGWLHETTYASNSQIRTPDTSPFRYMQSEYKYKYNAKKAVPLISGQTLISAEGVNNSAAALFCLVELLLKCH